MPIDKGSLRNDVMVFGNDPTVGRHGSRQSGFSVISPKQLRGYRVVDVFCSRLPEFLGCHSLPHIRQNLVGGFTNAMLISDGCQFFVGFVKSGRCPAVGERRLNFTPELHVFQEGGLGVGDLCIIGVADLGVQGIRTPSPLSSN